MEQPKGAKRDKYAELRHIADKVSRKKDPKHNNDEICKLNDNFKRHNLRFAYKLTKRMIAKLQPRTIFCRHTEELLLET